MDKSAAHKRCLVINLLSNSEKGVLKNARGITNMPSFSLMINKSQCSKTGNKIRITKKNAEDKYFSFFSH